MPKCGEKTEIYSRVCGYFRPVANWNKGKRQEFADRKVFRISNNEQRNNEGREGKEK